MSKVKVIDLIKYISSYGQDEIDLNSITEHFKDKPEEEQKLSKHFESDTVTDEEHPNKKQKLPSNYSLKNSNNFSNQEPNIKVPLYESTNTYCNKYDETIKEKISVPYLDISDEEKEEIKNIVAKKQMAIASLRNEHLRNESDCVTRRELIDRIYNLRNEESSILAKYFNKFKSDYSQFKNDGDIFKIRNYDSSPYLKYDESMSRIYVNPFVYKMFQKENEKLLWSQRIKMLEAKILSLELPCDASVYFIKDKFGEEYCEGLFRILEHYFSKEINRTDKDFDTHFIDFVRSIDTTNYIKRRMIQSIYSVISVYGYLESYEITFPYYVIKNSIFEDVNLEDFFDKVISETRNKIKNGNCSHKKIVSIINKLVDTVINK